MAVVIKKAVRGFSLVEVVFSLAVVVFAGFALVGLLMVGVQNNSDSRQRLQAASILESICATRRGAPNADFTAAGSAQPNFPLPALSTAVATGNINNISPLKPTYLTWNGTVTTLASGTARFGLLYSVNAPTTYVAVGTSGTAPSPGTASAYLYIYWPAAAPAQDVGTAHVELTTTFALP